MERILPDTAFIDVEYLGKRHYIACCLLEGGDRPAIIDPGPAVSLPALEAGLAKAGLSIDDLDAILLTHIHLDHAGGTGTLVRRNPRLRVFVHEIGAKHMIDPERLLASAERLYGDQMDALWGEFLAVPADNVESLSGGEKLSLAGRELEIAYTPGHASHHVSFLDTSNGIAFVGDTTGIRIANSPFVLPITPPPDIDLESWSQSLAHIESWSPEQLFVTHFGPGDNVDDHLEQFRSRLHHWSENVRKCVERNGDEAECVAAFENLVAEQIARALGSDPDGLYRQGGAPEMSWHGLARYWRKKQENDR